MGKSRPAGEIRSREFNQVQAYRSRNCSDSPNGRQVSVSALQMYSHSASVGSLNPPPSRPPFGSRVPGLTSSGKNGSSPAFRLSQLQ